MNFGLRSRAAARGLFNPKASTEEPKGNTTDEQKGGKATTTEDEPGASDEELDENGNPIKKTDGKGGKATTTEDEPGASTEEDKTGKATTPEEDKAKAGLKGNARIKAILGAPNAAAQRPLAEFLALDTEIDAATASTILGKVSATGPAPKAGEKSPFLKAMQNTANPTTPAASAPGAAASGKEGEAALADMMATLKSHGFTA